MLCIPVAYQSILQNPMAKKYKLFQRTDQNTPQTKHRKNLMTSKKNNNRAILADFSPYRFEVSERSHFPTKNPKINTFVVKSLLESNSKRFRKSAKPKKNFNLKPETKRKKLIPITGATILLITMKYERNCNQFLSFKSEPYLSTRSKTSMHLKKCKVFSSFRRPKRHFGRMQGHQRAGALTRSITIFQSTSITVYEVEHQKTVNTKLGKQTIWFSEVIEEFRHYYREESAGRHKKIENEVALHS